MREPKRTSRAITEVRGPAPRGFSGGVTGAERYRKSLETRLRNLTNKKAAQGFLNRAEEKMFRHLTRKKNRASWGFYFCPFSSAA